MDSRIEQKHFLSICKKQEFIQINVKPDHLGTEGKVIKKLKY